MRFISILALLFSISISTNSFAQTPDDFDNSSDRETSQILAFVGKKVFLSDVPIKPDPTFNENGEEDIIVFPQKLGFEARYEVLEMVSGEYDNSIIDLIAFSSYSENHELSDMDTVLVFVDEKQGERVLGSYYFYKVNRTTDGDWATCGDSYTHNDPDLSIDEKEPLEPISFLEPWTADVPSFIQKVDDVLAEYYDDGEVITDDKRVELQSDIDIENAEIDLYFQPSIWRREGSQAICELGIRVDDLFAFENRTIFLPEKRRDICQARHEADIQDLDYADRNQVLDRCVDLLEIQNIPAE